MVDGTHQEDPFTVRQFEVRPLHDHRAGLDDEEAADQHEEELRAAQYRQRCHRTAEPQRPGVAEEDLGGRRVPPEEADDRADDGRGHDGEVEGVADVVALRDVGRVQVQVRARLDGLPEADDDVGPDGEDGCAGGETVEPVGHVHAVRGRRDDEVDPDEVEPVPDDDTDDAELGDRSEIDREVADQGDAHGGRRVAVAVGEHDRQERPHGRHDDLAAHLGPARETETPLAAGLQEVVDEADDAEAHHQEQHQERRDGGLVAGQEQRDEVAEQRGADDHDSAHRRRPALGVVALRAVVADELAPLQTPEQPDEDRCEEERERHRQRPGGQQSSHENDSPSRSPRNRSPAEFEDFTSTVSPGTSAPERKSNASSDVSK